MHCPQAPAVRRMIAPVRTQLPLLVFDRDLRIARSRCGSAPSQASSTGSRPSLAGRDRLGLRRQRSTVPSRSGEMHTASRAMRKYAAHAR